MSFTDLFVRRPVLAIVVNLVIIIAGLQAIRSLNVRQYPRLESATITVRTAYVGASSDLVRGFITTPLERAIAAADGIDFIESSDAQIAAMYLSFGSKLLEENQVTDYLIRVVQPRLSAIEGVQRSDILGGRTFAIRAWLKPARMAALNVSPSQVRQALAANNYLAAVGETKGALVQVNLTVSTDLKSVGEFRRLVIRQENGALVRLEDVADVVL